MQVLKGICVYRSQSDELGGPVEAVVQNDAEPQGIALPPSQIMGAYK